MGKLAQTASKYTIIAKFDAEGTVEKPDVIGAVFGQTEGLLGNEMDLRELQRTGRIGRIEVTLENSSGKTRGTISIPSSLDSSETALIAACTETIERVGPCNAKIWIEKVEDVRIKKRQYVIDRAKEILSKIFEEGMPDTQELAEQLKESVRSNEITTYKDLPAGPQLDNYDSIVIVEGRADVMKLLKNGIKNVIAIEGSSVPDAIKELTKKKTSTVFLDGDRGGDLELKELLSTCEVDFVARAPRGKEVEELTKKEIYKCLRERVPSDVYKTENMRETAEGKTEVKFKEENSEEASFPEDRRMRRPMRSDRPERSERIERSDRSDRPERTESENRDQRESKKKFSLDQDKADKFKEAINGLTGTRAASLMNDDLEIIGKLPSKEIFNALKELKADVVVIDSEINQRLVNYCASRGVKYLVGMELQGRISAPENIKVFTVKDFQ